MLQKISARTIRFFQLCTICFRVHLWPLCCCTNYQPLPFNVLVDVCVSSDSGSYINLARLSPSSSVSAPAVDGAESTWVGTAEGSPEHCMLCKADCQFVPNTKPISCILDSNFWSRHDGEIKQNRQGLENATLNIIIVESKVTWTGLPGAPLISKKRKCVSTSLMWRDAS